MWKKFRKFIDAILSILFPPRCSACEEVISYRQFQRYGFCEICYPQITPVRGRTCDLCGAPLRQGENGVLCSNCIRRKGNVHYVQGRALFEYSGPMKQAMYHFKTSHRTGVRKFFIKTIREDERLSGWIEKHHFEAVVPVPMFRDKVRRRGYNQAELMAQEISREFRIPLRTDLVCRVEDTKPMKELTEQERKNNLKNAFKNAKSSVKLNQILLIDDIFTTGGTMDEVSKALQEAGVKHVYFLVMCIGRSDKKRGMSYGCKDM